MKMERKPKGATTSLKIITEATDIGATPESNGKRGSRKRRQSSAPSFANLLEKINEGFVALDAQMNYTYINQRGSELLKREPQDLIGKNYWDVYPEDSNTSFGQAYLRVLKTQTPVEIEDYYAPTGRWLQHRIFPFEDGLSIFFGDITERKDTEDTVRRTPEEWTDFVENASVGMHWVGPDGVIIWANRFELEMLGYTAEEYIGHHIAEFHADMSVIEDILRRLAQGETLNEYPAQMLCKDGSLRDVLINSNVFWENGKFVHTRCFTRDITERKRAEEALRESEERFQTLANGSPVLLWVNGLEGCEFVNREHLDFLGVSAQTDIRGYDWSSFVHPEDRDAYLGAYLSAFENQATFSAEFRFRRHDGKYRWMRSEATPRRAADGSFLGYVGATIDITVRKRAEQALYEKDQQLRRIADVTPTLFIQCSRDLRYLFVNRAAAEVFGYPIDEIIGKPIREILGEDAFKVILPYVERVLKGESVEYETEIPYQKIGTRFMHVVYVPERDADGNVIGWIATVADITERRRAEERLRTVVESAPNALLLVDVNGRISLINSQAERLFGYEREELLGAEVDMLVPERFRSLHAQRRAGFFDQPATRKMGAGRDLACLRKDGTEVPVEIGLNPLATEEGAFVLISVIDITERRRAQLALTEFARQQEALYQFTDQLQRAKSLEDIFDAALDAILNALQCDRASILLLDDTDVMHFVAWRGLSEGYRKATDGHSPWKPNEENPQPICMNDVDTAELSESLRTVVKTEGIGSLAFIPLVSNGKLIGKFMAYFNDPHGFSDGETELSLTIARQLAVGIERKRAERALRDSEEGFRTLANTMPSMVWSAAPDGTITYANDQWFHYAGISPQANTRQWPELVLHPDDYERWVSEWRRALNTVPDEYLIEVRNRRYDGQYRWFQTRAVPARDSNGKAIAWYGVSTDIHDRKEAERRLVLLTYISEVLRKIEDPQELMYAVAKIIGEHLQVKRCLFNETDVEKDLEIIYRDYYNGVQSVAGVRKISDYSSITSAEMSAGKTVINTDSKIDPRTAQDYERTYAKTRERAYVAVPLMRENRWVGTLWASDDVPRQWSKEEVSLLETVAERTWTVIEKLRMNADLSESEARYRFIVENTSDGIWHIELTEPMPLSLTEEEQLDWYYEHAVMRQCNLGLARMYGYHSVEEVIGLPMREVMPRENPVNLELSRQFIRSGYRLVDAESREVSREGRELVFLNNMIGVVEDGKLTGEWGTNRDITERKRIEEERNQLLQQEQALRASAEQAKAEAERELAERKLAEAALGEWVETPLPHETRPAWMRYGMAIGITVLAILLRAVLHPILGDFAPFATLYGAVAFSVWFGGVGPALLSVVIGYLGAEWFIIAPGRAIILNAEHVAGLGLFLFSNTVIIALGQAMRRAQQHAHQSARVAVERQSQVETQLLQKQQTEASLRQSEALYRAIARSIPAGGVYVIDKDFRYVVAEGPVTDAFGLSREMLEGHTVSEVFPKEPAERMEARLQRNFAGETVDFETVHNGRVYWTQQAPMTDSLGQADNAIVLTIDITERKQMEEALKESERKFSLIFHKLPFAAALSRPVDGTLADVNEAFESVFGYTRQEALGRTSLELGISLESESRDSLLAAIQQHGSVRNLEVELYTKPRGARIFLLNLDIVGIGGEKYILQTAQDITERKQAEEALRRSEERFARFMQYLPGLAWIKDREGHYVYANAAAEKAFRTPREKLYGMTDEEIFPAETAAQFRKNDELALLDEKGVQVTETLEHDDGVLHYSLVSKFPIPGPDGSTTLIGGTAFDITERKQAEEALRESEERFRALLRQATAGIVRKDADGRFIFVNQAFCNMLGYDETELLGKPIWQFTHQDDLEENKRLFDRTMVEGIPFKLEKRLIRKDGSVLWVDVSVSPIMDAAGMPQSAVAVEVDITGRKQAEEALRESKELYRNLFDTVPVAVYTCDANGLIQEFNQRAVELWGREPRKNDPNEKYCGSFKIYYPDGRFMPHEECPMARILRRETLAAHELEILVERPDGTRRNIIPHPLALKNERGEIVGAINCLYDITERKQAEEALQQLNLQLENRVEKRTVELQAVNQSLRNEIAERLKVEDALHESRKRLQILSQRLVDVQEEERRAIARELHDRVGQSLSALNINLVILDNQISGQVPEPLRVRLDDSMQLVAETITLVRDVMSDLRPPVLDDYGLEAALQSHIHSFQSRYGIEVQFEKADQPIPRLGASVEMTVLRITQEALINVARHANASQVNLSLTRDERFVRLSIQDNGTGITSWQEANRPGSHGLTIMRERAEALGGDLKVSSVPGKGTKVEATIPIETGHEGNIQKERRG